MTISMFTGSLLWVAGLCMAGSEGPIYINILGIGVFIAGSLFLLKGVKND